MMTNSIDYPNKLDWKRTSWIRLFVVIGVLCVSYFAYSLSGTVTLMPWPLFASLVALLMASAFWILKNSIKSPLLPFLAVFLIFTTVFVDNFMLRKMNACFKVNQFTFIFSVLFSFFYFVRDIKFYWSYFHIRLATLFFLLTLVYFFIYASDFDITRVKYGYTLLITGGLEINSPPVRIIILTSSLGLLVANVLALSPFSPNFLRFSQNSSQIDQLLCTSYSVAAIASILIMLLILSQGATDNFGMHCYFPVIAISGAAFWHLIGHYHRDAKSILSLPLSKVVSVGFMFSSVFMPLVLNKTSLVSVALAFIFFFWMTRKADYGSIFKSVWLFASESLLAKLMIVGVVVILIAFGVTSGTFDLFSNKMDYVVSGFESGSSIKVREGNWKYFLQDWWQTLSLQHILLGYGIGASRKAIFYISAMRDTHHERCLVQTLHNSYMEYIYDYGCTCILYFGIYFSFLVRIFKDIQAKISMDTLVLAAAQISIILFTGFYGLTDGIRVQVLIQIFTLLGFLEGLKKYYATRSVVNEEGFRLIPVCKN